MKVFLDANVFFAAAGSPKGGSAFVLELAKKKKFAVVTVTHVLAEAEKNIKQKLGKTALLAHYQNILDANLAIQQIGSISIENVVKLEKLVPLKDGPILLGAILSDSQY